MGSNAKRKYPGDFDTWTNAERLVWLEVTNLEEPQATETAASAAAPIGQEQLQKTTHDSKPLKQWCDMVWKWLEKPRGVDSFDWLQRMARIRGHEDTREYIKDDEDFEKFLHWICMENEFTVINLRTSRNPMKSLEERQLHNCLLRYHAHKAALRARERKTWKYGPCSRCDDAPAKGNRDTTAPWRDMCEVCENRYLVAGMLLEAVCKAKMLRGKQNEHGNWMWYASATGNYEDAAAWGYTEANTLEAINESLRSAEDAFADEMIEGLKYLIDEHEIPCGKGYGFTPKALGDGQDNMDFEAEEI